MKSIGEPKSGLATQALTGEATAPPVSPGVPQIPGYELPTIKAGPYSFKPEKLSKPKVEDPLDVKKKQLDIAGKQLDNAIKNRKLGDLKKNVSAGMSADKAGKATMGITGLEDMQELEDILFVDGELNKKAIAEAYINAPTDAGSMINTLLLQGTDAWLRIKTGAVANKSEIAANMQSFKPRPWDSEKVVRFKVDKLKHKLKTFTTRIIGEDPTASKILGEADKVREAEELEVDLETLLK